jgi:TPR repeat protein
MVCDAPAPAPGTIDGDDPEAVYKHGIEAFNSDDFYNAFNRFSEAAEVGYPPAENEVGRCYYLGKGTEKDLDKAFEWFSRSASHGDASGLYNLGCCYYYGNGTVKSYTSAVE